MDMEHAERQEWVTQVAQINTRLNQQQVGEETQNE
jgi:hypothetical protein